MMTHRRAEKPQKGNFVTWISTKVLVPRSTTTTVTDYRYKTWVAVLLFRSLGPHAAFPSVTFQTLLDQTGPMKTVLCCAKSRLSA